MQIQTWRGRRRWLRDGGALEVSPHASTQPTSGSPFRRAARRLGRCRRLRGKTSGRPLIGSVRTLRGASTTGVRHSAQQPPGSGRRWPAANARAHAQTTHARAISLPLAAPSLAQGCACPFRTSRPCRPCRPCWRSRPSWPFRTSRLSRTPRISSSPPSLV